MTALRPPWRLALVDDHSVVRSGLRALLLQRVPELEVVGEANDGLEAISLAEQVRPDIVLMDIAMPQLNGIDTTARILSRFPDTRVIVLSVHSDEGYAARALRAGAVGYILKGATAAELEFCIRAVANGGTYLTPSTSQQVVNAYLRRVSGGHTVGSALTPRQREILQLIAEGHTSKAIAAQLNLSVKTVETHRTQLMRRLDIHDLAALVRYAIREGLVSSDK